MSSEQRLQFLLTSGIPRLLWKLSLPNVAGVGVMTAVTFFDAWFVGHLGNQALASLALVFPFQALMQMMAGGAIGGGITSAIARATGSGNFTVAKKTAFNGLLVFHLYFFKKQSTRLMEKKLVIPPVFSIFYLSIIFTGRFMALQYKRPRYICCG